MDIANTVLHLAPGALEAGQPAAPAPPAPPREMAKDADRTSGATGDGPAPGDAAGTMPLSTHVELDIDNGSRRVVGRFVDNESGDTVRQVPTEEMLRLLAKTREMIGTLFDETA